MIFSGPKQAPGRFYHGGHAHRRHPRHAVDFASRLLRGLVIVCASCSLYAGGLEDGGVPGKDGGTDAIDEPGPPMPCTTPKGACANAVPAGWTLSAFEDNRMAACPSNYTSIDLLASPTALAGACSCSCQTTTQPSCATGSITFKSGPNNGNCNTIGNTYAVSNGLCVAFQNAGALQAHFGITQKLGLTPGVCAAMPVSDPNKVSATAMRACVPPPTCEEDVCAGKVPTGTRSCVVRDGDLACPAPFTEKVAVAGTDVTLGCGCGACAVSATCGDANVNFFNDAQCAVQRETMIADGACHDTNQMNASHFMYVAVAMNATCSAPVSGPTPTLTAPRTVCCRP